MKFTAVMIVGRNTFFSLPLENDDDSRDVVEEDAKYLADRLGAYFVYLEDTSDQ